MASFAVIIICKILLTKHRSHMPWQNYSALQVVDDDSITARSQHTTWKQWWSQHAHTSYTVL